MTSFTAQTVSFLLHKTKFLRRLPTDIKNFEQTQAKILATPSSPSAQNKKSCKTTERLFQGRSVWTLAPENREPTADVLYWHGGAYIYPATPTHWNFLARMAAVYGWNITVPLYPLAPASKTNTIMDFAVAFTSDWMDRPSSTTRIVAGDSAGGGLAAATLMVLRDSGAKLPDKAILICPWLDIEPDHPDQTYIEKHDVMLTKHGLRAAGRMYTGDNSNDIHASPLRCNWDDLPPLLVFGGGNDILVTDARALKKKLPKIVYEERAGMIHDWPILFFPESRVAQATMARYAKEHLDKMP